MRHSETVLFMSEGLLADFFLPGLGKLVAQSTPIAAENQGDPAGAGET
jgi:hypothetical protein